MLKVRYQHIVSTIQHRTIYPPFQFEIFPYKRSTSVLPAYKDNV